jgi:hypothetical protein
MAENRLVVLRQVALTDKHKPTGGTRHYIGSEELPAPASLKIARYEEDAGYYLFYCDEAGTELTDTYHDSLDQALAQAEWEFGVEPGEWEPVQQ